MKLNIFQKRNEQLKEITKFLGRKPKDEYEYQKIYTLLFRGDLEERRKVISAQRARHLSHGYGNSNANKKYCVFCEMENRL